MSAASTPRSATGCSTCSPPPASAIRWDELDQMQAEADAILRDTLQCFEHGAIEEGTLTAFNIAIEQFHNAVADRKALLMSMPQNLQRASAQFRAASNA